MSALSANGGTEGALYLSSALGVMAVSGALVLVLGVISISENLGRITSFIRIIRGRLSAYGEHVRGWWYLLRWHLKTKVARELCVNCGPTSKGRLLVRCRMWDRCTQSQVREIEAGGEVPTGIISGRPLCVQCAESNKYTCWVCELEAAAEKKK